MKIDGLTDFEADLSDRTCTFKVKPDVDYKTKLAEFAETNPKLADYEIQ
ncbi:MAG: hypothetical protein HQ567_05915 [Candidatus Nealsonbacteria bacterium]|nr:hypothetical protein [Candidatus Nealsonbacteria bacterium]